MTTDLEGLAELTDAILSTAVPLARELGLERVSVSSEELRVSMPQSPFAANHIGTVYAGATFTLAELTAGTLAALRGGGDLIPVLVGADLRYVAPSTGPVTCCAQASEDLSDVAAQTSADRRTETIVHAECVTGEVVVCRASFSYRWFNAAADPS